MHFILKLQKSLYPAFKEGWLGSRDLFFNFDTHNDIPGTTEAAVATFCVQIEYTKCLAFDDRLLSNGRGQSHVTRFLNFAPIISLESVKLRNSNCAD